MIKDKKGIFFILLIIFMILFLFFNTTVTTYHSPSRIYLTKDILDIEHDYFFIQTFEDFKIFEEEMESCKLFIDNLQNIDDTYFDENSFIVVKVNGNNMTHIYSHQLAKSVDGKLIVSLLMTQNTALKEAYNQTFLLIPIENSLLEGIYLKENVEILY